MDIGRIGVWFGTLALEPAKVVRATLEEIEELGYGAVWFPEGVATKESLSQAAVVLAWTRRIIVATGIANIWARDAVAMANGAKTLSEAYPGRFVLGLGVSHASSVAERGHSYARPVTMMRSYLDVMDNAAFQGVEPPRPTPRVLAALGPKMLKLAAERTWGAHTYLAPVAHTVFARTVLGSAPLLAPEQAVVVTSDRDAARSIARKYMAYYLSLDNYRINLQRSGFREDDLSNGGSDRLVDSIVALGNVEAIRDRVRAHLQAGADHVCVQAIGSAPLAQLRELAPALLEL